MIEVLVSLLIIVLGLLGLAGLQVRIQQSEFESYQRAQALVLLQDMVERIHQQRVVAKCFRFTTDTAAGTPYLGAGSGGAPACAALPRVTTLTHMTPRSSSTRRLRV